MPTDIHPRAAVRRMRGTSLIEVMVAVVVLSTGLLGMVALQAKALRNNQSSLERSQAVILTYSIIDRMHANVIAAHAGAYNAPGGAELAGNDLEAWSTEIQTALGETAAGTVNCNINACIVTIQWDDSRGIPSNASPTTYSVSTTVRL